MPSRTLACIECKCSGYGHLLFWGPARCVFVLQKPFCATKRLAPEWPPRRFGSKVATRSYMKNQSPMNRPKKTPVRPPKWDAFHFRLPDSRDQLRLIELFKRSGARTKTEYIRARILDEHFRVVTVDKSREDFVRRLTEFTAALNKIGVLYNQAVRAINTYHSPKAAVVMLRKLEGYAADIHRLQERVIALTESFRTIDR